MKTFNCLGQGIFLLMLICMYILYIDYVITIVSALLYTERSKELCN